MNRIVRSRSRRAASWLFIAILIVVTSLTLLHRVNANQLKTPATVNVGTLQIRSGAEWGYHVVGTIQAGANVTVLARSPNGQWAFIWSNAGDGWVPLYTLLISTASGSAQSQLGQLPIWANPMRNAQYKPAGTVVWANAPMLTGPNTNYNQIGAVPNGAWVNVLALDPSGQWAFIWSSVGDAWVPINSVSFNANRSLLPIWTRPMNGAVLNQ